MCKPVTCGCFGSEPRPPGRTRQTASTILEQGDSKSTSSLDGKPQCKLSHQRGPSFSLGQTNVKVNAVAYVWRVGKAPQELLGVGSRSPMICPQATQGRQWWS